MPTKISCSCGWQGFMSDLIAENLRGNSEYEYHCPAKVKAKGWKLNQFGEAAFAQDDFKGPSHIIKMVI